MESIEQTLSQITIQGWKLAHCLKEVEFNFAGGVVTIGKADSTDVEPLLVVDNKGIHLHAAELTLSQLAYLLAGVAQVLNMHKPMVKD